jgi:hypothetical protein
MEVLFLPPAYTLVLIAAAIAVGVIFDQLVREEYIVASGALFLLFTVSQLIFRIILQEEPARLVGQAIYFTGFLFVAHIANVAKKRFLAR